MERSPLAVNLYSKDLRAKMTVTELRITLEKIEAQGMGAQPVLMWYRHHGNYDIEEVVGAEFRPAGNGWPAGVQIE